MNEIFSLIALDHPDWTIPWAGLGALLLGLGSTLSGIAAIMAIRKGKHESQNQDNDASDKQRSDGNGGGVSDGSDDSPGATTSGND